MLKVAIVGCGELADAHASTIQRIKGCEIVGVCDREPLMAKQLYERFPVKRYFDDLISLLGEARPDVVHITTPPEAHFETAKLCLEQGCHVYVEKPFTLNAGEAQRLLELADERELKLTVGHNEQFTHVANRMRELVRSGYLGGVPVHMESYCSYDLADQSYGNALASNDHWVRKLPGKCPQNVIAPGIARIAEFLTGDPIHVIAYGIVSPPFKQINESEFVDELRVIICENERTTAYFTFSTHMRPSIHEFRVYGSENGLVLDQDHEILIRLRGKNFKSYAEKFIPSVLFTAQHLGNLFTNTKLFLNSDFHMDSGRKYLIESFYLSIRQGTPVPIPYREILFTARIVDAIIDQVRADRERIDEMRPPAEIPLREKWSAK